MALTLKERMLQTSLSKEQRRAERESEVTLDDGPKICAKLKAGRLLTSVGLTRMQLAVRTFREGGHTLDMALQRMSPKKRAMYRMVRSEFQGEWFEMFERLANAIPAERRENCFAMSWDEWRALGGSVGMNDEQVVHGLRVMLVFRDR